MSKHDLTMIFFRVDAHVVECGALQELHILTSTRLSEFASFRADIGCNMLHKYLINLI